MTDYTNLLGRLAVSAGDQECLYADAKAAIEALQSRVAELESRLEVTPEHDIDGIAARDATIKLQDGRIAELKSHLAESEDTNKALRVRLGSELERANELVADLQVERSFLLSERASREKQEPALYVQSDHIVQAKFSPFLGRICQQPFDGPPMTRLYADPPVAATARLTDSDNHANELRRMARKIGHPAGDVPSVMRAAADRIDELERLVAAFQRAEAGG